MQMTEAEIVRSYKKAENRQKQIKILAELNLCEKEDIREILRKHGCEVPACGNRYTAAKKNAEAPEADGSKRKRTKITEKNKRLLISEEQEDVGMCQQDVGIMSENRQLKTEPTKKKAAPTACQPSQPVDVWSEEEKTPDVLIRFAESEIKTLQELIDKNDDRIREWEETNEDLRKQQQDLIDWLTKAGGQNEKKTEGANHA